MAPPGKRRLLGDNSPLWWENTKQLLKKQKEAQEAQEELVQEAKKKLKKEQEARAAVIPSLSTSKKTEEEYVCEDLVIEDSIFFEESLMVSPLQTLRRCAAKLDPVELKAAREEAAAKCQVKKRRAPASRKS